MTKERTPLLRNKTVQALLTSLLCILLGLLIGFVVLLIINPSGAGKAIATILKNFMTYANAVAPEEIPGQHSGENSSAWSCAAYLSCSPIKVGLFNIGAAGQYVVGAGACLYCALAWGLPWYVCLHRRPSGRCDFGRHLRPAEGVLQRQRGHLLHHAQLDQPLSGQHHLEPGEGGSQPLHPYLGLHQPRRLFAQSGAGEAV